MTSVDDVSAAQKGDQKAFERIFHAHASRVHALACWLGDEQDADDITQDVFVLVWRKIASFDRRSSFSTWLHRIAVNQILSRRRLDRDRTARIIPPALHTSASAEERVALDDLIAQLTPELRDVFVLHDVEGYAHDEIAVLLNIPAGTSGSRLHRARQLLRAELNATA